MSEIIKHAIAKVNLMLHITGVRNNYHEMQSIFGFADNLCDILKFNTQKKFSSQSAFIPNVCMHDNLLHKMRDFLVKTLGNIHIPDVEITKNIPEGSGLGGGSSDAAAFMLFVLELNNIPVNEIVEIAMKTHIFGMDIQVFLYKNIFNADFVLLEGIGKFAELQSIQSQDKFKIIIFPPKQSSKLSTKLVFNKFDENPIFEKKQTFNTSFSINTLAKQKNSLQKAAIAICPEIEETIELIQKTDACIARMSGSGNACFGLYMI